MHSRTCEFITLIEIDGLIVTYKTSLNETKFMALKLFEESYRKHKKGAKRSR